MGPHRRRLRQPAIAHGAVAGARRRCWWRALPFLSFAVFFVCLDFACVCVANKQVTAK